MPTVLVKNHALLEVALIARQFRPSKDFDGAHHHDNEDGSKELPDGDPQFSSSYPVPRTNKELFRLWGFEERDIDSLEERPIRFDASHPGLVDKDQVSSAILNLVTSYRLNRPVTQFVQVHLFMPLAESAGFRKVVDECFDSLVQAGFMKNAEEISFIQKDIDEHSAELP